MMTYHNSLVFILYDNRRPAMMGSAYGSLPLCLNTFIVMLLLVANKLSLSVCLSLPVSLYCTSPVFHD